MTDQPTHHVDVAIIGTGSAGMSAYRAARAHSDRLLLIEKHLYGTTCARVGCMPSKLLIAAAEAAHHVRHAAGFGVEAGPPVVDGRAVMARVRAERDRFVGFVLDDVQSWPAEHRLIGDARFVAPHRLRVGEALVEAKRIVIATGSRPTWPAAWNALGDRLIVNDAVFDWEDLPRAVAVFGNGVIGMELAQALARLGVRVRLFGLGGLVGPLIDPQVIAAARAAFAQDYRFDPEAEVASVTREGDQVVVRYRGKPELGEADAEIEERFDYLLAATGRRPNLDLIGLEHSGLALDARGTPLGFDPATGRIGDSHIFIAGDAAPDVPLLHEAADLGRIAGDNAGRYPQLRRRKRRSPLSVVFSDPQIALAGEALRSIEARGVDFVTGAVDFAGQGRSRVMRRNQGRLSVYVERGSGRFLGAEMVGPDAEHLAHLLAWAHQARLTVGEMLDSPFYHPVIEEGLRSALRAARDLAGAPAEPDCLDCRLMD